MVIIREAQMWIKVLHQDKGYSSKKLLAEFPTNDIHCVGNLCFQC